MTSTIVGLKLFRTKVPTCQSLHFGTSVLAPYHTISPLALLRHDHFLHTVHLHSSIPDLEVEHLLNSIQSAWANGRRRHLALLLLQLLLELGELAQRDLLLLIQDLYNTLHFLNLSSVSVYPLYIGAKNLRSASTSPQYHSSA